MKEKTVKIEGSVAVVSGANRGIGARFVQELLRRDVAKVYAAARNPDSLADVVASDGRVVPMAIDINDEKSVAAAAAIASDATLLINNAGILNFGDALEADLDSLRQEMETNYFGLIRACRGFVPVLENNGPAAILNVLTIIALAPMTGMGGYCASKAAAYSFTQSLRNGVASRGISVHGAFPGGVDTDMLAAYDGPKADPLGVAVASLDGVEGGIEDITPDDFSSVAFKSWNQSPKSLEAMFAG